MSIESKTREIEGLTVTSTQLPALHAYTLFARLGKALGPSMAGVIFDDVDLDLGGLVGGLYDDLDLVKAVLVNTFVVVDGEKIELTDGAKINKVFSGRFKALLLTMKFALVVNFSDFLDDGLAAQ